MDIMVCQVLLYIGTHFEMLQLLPHTDSSNLQCTGSNDWKPLEKKNVRFVLA